MDFRLRFDGGVASRHKIPADELSQSLGALQDTVYLLAMGHENRDVEVRARVPNDIARHYVVLCEVPQAGSYAVPFEIGALQPALFPTPDIEAVTQQFTQVLEAIASHKPRKLRGIVADGARRRRVVSALLTLLPKPGSNTRRFIEDLRPDTPSPSFEFSESHTISLRQFAQETPDQNSIQTVTGRLDRIDFAKRSVAIRLPGSNRSISCTYEEGIEEMLLENRRGLIQVTGQVEWREEDDTPHSITDVISISDLDLSAFEIAQVDVSGVSLRFNEPLTLEPFLDESEQLICLQHAELGIDVFAQTRDQLWEEVREQIAMLWREFALEDDQVLAPSASQLKQRLRAAIAELSRAEEVANAA